MMESGPVPAPTDPKVSAPSALGGQASSWGQPRVVPQTRKGFECRAGKNPIKQHAFTLARYRAIGFYASSQFKPHNYVLRLLLLSELILQLGYKL